MTNEQAAELRRLAAVAAEELRRHGIPGPAAVAFGRYMDTVVPPLCPGVVCRCDDQGVSFCPMHGTRTR